MSMEKVPMKLGNIEGQLKIGIGASIPYGINMIGKSKAQ
jgi:hypothetical protein